MAAIFSKTTNTELRAAQIPLNRRAALVWNTTHEDFRSDVTGERMVMVSGTRLIGLDHAEDVDHPDHEELLGLVEHSRDKINKDRIRFTAKAVFKKHGVTDIDPGVLNQWFSSFSGAIDFAKALGSSDTVVMNHEAIRRDLDAAKASFYA